MAMATGFCFISTHAQTTKQDSCVELRAMFDQSVYMLDSLLGVQIELRRQFDSIRIEVAKSKTQINNLQKEKKETTTILIDAKKLISEQTNKINQLEAEIKKLSGDKSSTKKGT